MYNQNQIARHSEPDAGIVGSVLGALYDLAITGGKAISNDAPAVITTPAGTAPIDPIAYILMLAGSGGSANLEALTQSARHKHSTPEDILGFIWDSPYVQKSR